MNEKCGERERLRSIFQQIQQKTKDVLCSPYAHALRPVTKWWDAVKAPSSSCCITGSAASSGPWREVFCETRGEEGGTACLHSPPALHSGGEHVKGWFWEDAHPAYYWRSSHAHPLERWPIFWVYHRCRLPCLQCPQSRRRVVARCVLARSQAWTRYEDVGGFGIVWHRCPKCFQD